MTLLTMGAVRLPDPDLLFLRFCLPAEPVSLLLLSLGTAPSPSRLWIFFNRFSGKLEI